MKLITRRNSIICLLCLLSFTLGGFIVKKADEEKITIAIVKQAQKIIGLDFTDAEADSMLENMEKQRKNSAELRKLKIPNSVSPSLNFNPLPVAYQYPDKANYFKVSASANTRLPADKGQLAFFTIGQLAELIRTRQISSVELTRFFIERIKKYNPTLFYAITITEERAMNQARKVDSEIASGKYRGLLHGIPFGAKDLLAAKDYKTTWGSVAYKDQTIDVDATVITRLENAGAVLVAKMTLGELAAIVFNAIQGADGKDLSVISAPFNYTSPSGTSLKGMRIGYLKAEFDRKYTNHSNDSITLSKLREMGADLVPIQLPELPYGDMLIILSAEAGAAFDELTVSNRDDLLVRQNKSAWPNGFRSSHFIPAVDYIQANRARTMLIAQLDKNLKDLDLYVSPSFGRNLLATNLSGHPCVVLPNGFRNGLPVSITFTGQLFGEGKLLRAAQAYQKATEFDEKHPVMNF